MFHVFFLFNCDYLSRCSLLPWFVVCFLVFTKPMFPTSLRIFLLFKSTWIIEMPRFEISFSVLIVVACFCCIPCFVFRIKRPKSYILQDLLENRSFFIILSFEYYHFTLVTIILPYCSFYYVLNCTRFARTTNSYFVLTWCDIAHHKGAR